MTDAAKLLDTSEAELRTLARSGVIPKIVDGRLPLVATVQGYCRHYRTRRRNEAQTATALGQSRAWLRKLAADGAIAKGADGLYDLDDVYRGYIRWLKDENRRASRTASMTRLQDARAQKIELELAARAGRLIEMADALAMVDVGVGSLVSSLTGLPARATRDLALRKRLEELIDEARLIACEKVAAAQAAVEAGLDPLEPTTLAAPAARKRGRKS